MGKEKRRQRGEEEGDAVAVAAIIRSVGSTEWLSGPPTAGTTVVLVPTHIPGLKGNTPAGKPDDAIGYAAEGVGAFGVQYDPAKFPLSEELKQLGLSEQAWADFDCATARQGQDGPWLRVFQSNRKGKQRAF